MDREDILGIIIMTAAFLFGKYGASENNIGYYCV